MMSVIGYVVGFILAIVIPPMFIAALFSFYHLDISLMSPVNWSNTARFITVFWTVVMTFTVIDGQHNPIGDDCL